MEAEQIKKRFCSFSDALWAGIPILPQAYYTYFGRGPSDGEWVACALGTGAIAEHGSIPDHSNIDDMIDQVLSFVFPYMSEARPNLWCPLDHQDRCGTLGSFARAVVHLNDMHKWSREDIAD